jgi:parallel beta-helix repeat protein
VIELQGASDVKLSHLNLTGAYNGIFAASGANADRITVEASNVYGNASYGVSVDTSNDFFTLNGSGVYLNGGSGGVWINGNDATLAGDSVYRNSGWGVQIGTRGHVSGSDVYGNSSGGVYAAVSGGLANQVVIENNRVFDNIGTGVQAYYDGVLARNNEAWGNTASGILIYYGAQAIANTAWGNTEGISIYGNSLAQDNRLYANTDYGLYASGGSTMLGNRVYGNANGGVYLGGWDNLLRNNLIEANGAVGVRINGGYYSSAYVRVDNNTIVQTQGDAIIVQGSSRNTRISNNILDVTSGGVALRVAADSESDFGSDYNLFMLSAGSGVAVWEGKSFANRTDWFYEVGYDQHSRSGDAQFVDINGADNTIGWDGSAVPGSVRIVDDGDPTFGRSGTWLPAQITTQTSGRGGDSLLAFPATAPQGATAQASWTFDGLSAGYYRVAVTWPPGYYVYLNGSYQYSAGNAVVTAYDGNTVVGEGSLGQYNGPGTTGADFVDAGSNWHTTMLVHISGASLNVVMDNVANGFVLADAVRIERLSGDYGQDDDAHLLAGSPAIDRGDPNALRQFEPQPNGNRIDLGAYGNTPQATPSTTPLIQVTSPNGLEKVEVGATVTIGLRSAGLLPTDTVLLLDSGATAPVDNWVPQVQQNLQTYATAANSGSYSNMGATPIDLSQASDPAPASVYNTYAYATYGVGSKLSYQLPVTDGDYQLVLHFVEPSTLPAGYRTFDINVNGVTQAHNVDIAALTGGYYKSLTLNYAVSAAGGQGLLVELVNTNASWTAVLSGLELRRPNPQGSANPVVGVELSTDNGASWSTIATGVALDKYGRANVAWTPTAETNGNTALIRATATVGATSVSDTSDEPFLIANGGKQYFVNDNSLVGDEYTTAVGDNANSGKDAAHPMASVAALLRAYDLDAGDIVYVDTGVYHQVTNAVLTAQDSGVEIRGAVQPGHQTVLDRGNTNSGTAVIELQGASDVKLSHLNLTGAYNGIFAASGANADRITVEASNVYGNAGYGVSIDTSNDNFLLSGGSVHNNVSTGILLRGDGDRVDGADVYGNAQWGVDASGANAAAAIVIAGSKIHDNTAGGIYAVSQVQVTGNQVFGHGAGHIGISLYYGGAVASGNWVYKNDIGIQNYYGSVATGNEVYTNRAIGIQLYSSTATGNRVYDNPTGIYESGYSQIENNLVYANNNVGISISGYHNGQMVRDNTIYQPVGDAVLVAAGANTVKLFNNIVWVNAGYAYDVGTGQATFASDYNLFNTPGVGAKVALWNNVQQTSFANWATASAQDAHGKAGDPLFLDIDGADNVLGEQGVITGNGFDDNFGLRANSPAIDAANMYVATRTDIQGLQRSDDPSTANTGDGLPLYVATPQAASSFNPLAGVRQNYRTTDSYINVALPFGFQFYGQTYNSVYADVNGFLQFGDATNLYGSTSNDNSLAALLGNVRIAPLWDNLSTYSPTDATRDLYVDTATAGQVTVRWAAVFEAATAKPVNFSVTLFADGRFRFDYGPSATGLTPTVGVSAGNGYTYVLAGIDGSSDLSSAASLMWNATPGLNYFDIGAYEFQGDSNDHTPPQVVGISQLPPDGGTTAAAFSSLQVGFTEKLDGISARSPANYDLLSAGADGIFGTPDDRHITVKPGYSFPETNLTLQLPDGPLADGHYRLTLSGTLGILDTAGNLLDGNADGVGGDDYVRNFTIDRSGNQPPTATDAVVSVAEDQSVLITLAGTDPNGDPLSYSLVSPPQFGTLSGFDPLAHTVVYTPNANFNGTDSFRFGVDDGKLGTDAGTVIVSVLPVNDVPAAGDVTVATDEDTAVAILLPGSDVETARAHLGFGLVTAPQHGTLIQNPGGLWTYVPDANFNGSDSFRYQVTDRGDPDGSFANPAASAPATVSVTVRPVNDAPTIAPIGTVQVDEGSLLSLPVQAADVDGNVLTYSLVNNLVAGAAIDPQTGIFTWRPADGPASQAFTVRVSDGFTTTDAAFNVVVNNVAPTISLNGVASLQLGQNFTLNFSATDPGQDTVSNWQINWGDGSTSSLPGTSSSVNHLYALGGNFAVTAVATDEDGRWTSAPLGLKVITPNRPPVAPTTQFATTPEEQAITLTLAYVDPDGDPLTFSITTPPAHGTLSGFNPATRQIVYTPDALYRGADSFVFQVDDGISGTASSTVLLTMTPVNHPPVATGETYSARPGQPLAAAAAQGVLINDVDPDGDPLRVAAYASGNHGGQLAMSVDGSFAYTSAAGFIGSETFTVYITDGIAPAVAETLQIDVVNHPPVATGETYAARPGQLLTVAAAQGVLINDVDADGDPLRVAAYASGNHGGQLAMNADGSFAYTSAAGFIGSETFTVYITDGYSPAVAETLQIDVVNHAPVANGETYTARPGQHLTVGAAQGVLVNDTDADGDPLRVAAYASGNHGGQLAMNADGSFGYTAAAGFVGNENFTVYITDGYSPAVAETLTITNPAPPSLQVTSLTANDSGFAARFNQRLDAGVLNLYSGQSSNPAARNLGAPDIVLTGPGSAVVRGSVVLDTDGQGFTFIATGGPLAAGNYTVRLASRADGVVTPDGRPLDGNADGTAGDDFLGGFTLNPNAAAAVLGIGDAARGPGQAFNLVSAATMLPITLTGAAGATQVQFSLHHDPSLLTVQGLSGGTLPVGSSLTVDTTNPGVMVVTIASRTPLGASVVIGDLIAQVPAGAAYGAKDLLHFSDVVIDGGLVPVRADDGLAVVGYLADTSGDGSISSLDFQRANRVLLRQDSGFGAWPLVDPLLLADIDRNGVLTGADAMKIALQAAGTAQKDIPAIPAGMPALSFAGIDPVVSLGSVTAAAGEMVRVPVLIDSAADLQSVVLGLRYDPAQVQLVGIDGTALTADFSAQVVRVSAGEVRIDASAAQALAGGSGELFWLRFLVAPSATGSVTLDLASARLNDTWLTLNPAPLPGADPTDGRINVLAASPVALPPAPTAAAAGSPASDEERDDGASLQDRPVLDFKRGAGRGFALGAAKPNLWLNKWLAEPGNAGGANHWTISGKRPTVH